MPFGWNWTIQKGNHGHKEKAAIRWNREKLNDTTQKDHDWIISKEVL
jgi:hypothetical protein